MKITITSLCEDSFAVKAIRQFGTNFIKFQLGMGERRYYIVGSYLAPGDGTTIQDMEAINKGPRGTWLIAAADFNVNLERKGGRGRDKEIAAVLATAGLEDIFGEITSATAHMVQRHADVGNGATREGSEVPD